MSGSPSDLRDVANWRLATQGLSSPRFEGAAGVVSFFGAVQAQDHGPAKWSLGLRTTGRTESEVEGDYGEGRIVRTHALRPTWHYLAPEDLRWVQGLTAGRVHAQNDIHYRKLALDAATLNHCHAIIQRALAGGNHLTRQEIRERLAAEGVDAEGQRLAYIMMHAELDLLVCSGSPRSRHTYALVDEWVEPVSSMDAEDALARLTLTYFRSHGPSTDRDFSWWSSLRLSEVRAGMAMVADRLQQREFDGVTYTWAERPPAETSSRPRVNLIQVLDEYVVGYRESRSAIDIDAHHREWRESGGRYDPLILDGQIAGTWRRRQTAATLRAEISLAIALSEPQLDALREEAERLAGFFGQELELVL
ncbi:MAG TPA: winged helix DNA-binding domain-containing protein [Acidimicrobiia bacterium]|nr:winged helix DNA-binding domain-containing protein [Acidimicrobiia bacterium]